MKLLNLNVAIKVENTDAVIELVKSQKPDFCTFQEVMYAHDESCKDLFKSGNKFEKTLGYPYQGFAPLFIADGILKNGVKHLDFGGQTEQGSLLLSKYKIAEHKNEFYYNEYRYFYETSRFYEDEWCRSIQNAIVETNAGLLQIINIHGLWNKDKVGDNRTAKQTEFILSHIRQDIPCIVVGDFNLLPTSDDIQKLSKVLRNLIVENNVKTTRPASKGQLVCDYIFVNDKVKVKNFKVLASDTSDHLPLVMDFEI